jgi:hypothetical protein
MCDSKFKSTSINKVKVMLPLGLASSSKGVEVKLHAITTSPETLDYIIT